MTYYLELPIADGESVLVEVTNQVEGVAPASRRDGIVGRLSETFDEAFGRFQQLAAGAVAQARGAGAIDRMTIEFGLKATAKGGFVVAETTGEAHITVAFEWARGRADTRKEQPDGVE
jgi:hypothetical protein